MRKITLTILLLFITTSVMIAQKVGPDGSSPQGQNLQVPEGWEWRFDHSDTEVNVGSDPESSDVYFVNMTPGWHITTGPGGIYYHNENNVEGDYELNATLYLFDTEGRNREAFGLFFGRADLKNENQCYHNFLIRNTGEYLIKKRIGEETESIQGWTKTEAMNLFTDQTEYSAQNDFKVKASGDKLSFYLNGVELTTYDKSGFTTDGIYGLRVNHSINLHISSLKVN